MVPRAWCSIIVSKCIQNFENVSNIVVSYIQRWPYAYPNIVANIRHIVSKCIQTYQNASNKIEHIQTSLKFNRIQTYPKPETYPPASKTYTPKRIPTLMCSGPLTFGGLTKVH